jgi:hypothetical protein
MKHPEAAPKPLGLPASVALYVTGAILLYLATRFTIPSLVQLHDLEPVVTWFIAAGCGVFLPLVAIGLALLLLEPRPESARALQGRLWAGPVSRADWLWTLAGTGAIVLLSAPLVAMLEHFYGRAAFNPPFLGLQPLAPGRYWILAAWLPFFFINILGEAFLWHAVMLPRQARSFGRSAWLISGIGWGFFHLALPWQLLVALIPTVLVIPWLIQQRANIWPGVVLHALVNGSGFLAVTLGLV